MTKSNKWIQKKNEVNNIKKMAETLGVSEILAKILANRGVTSRNKAIMYLKPEQKYFRDAHCMKGIEEATSIIFEGIKAGSRFCIYGDYDVDGVCSTVILYKSIKKLGGNVDYYIPHREQEGYGLNLKAVDEIASKYDCLIAVDNGIVAFDEVKKAIEYGLKVIIIDHHEPAIFDGQEVLPIANAIINPRQSDCFYPFKAMCAAGISYKFAEYLFLKMEREWDLANELLIFASMATFCDVVDLVDENRIIVKNGLGLLNNRQNINLGLEYLISARNLEYHKINAYAIGFIIGPCINASGRLENAEIAVKLFLTENQAEAAELANQLVALNEERKELCAKWVDIAINGLDAEKLDKVLVLYLPDAHESIAGIVAGRVKEAVYRPTIVFTNSGSYAKGSARSIENYNIFEAMQEQRDLFIRFGGHAMAAGASLEITNIDILRERLNSTCTLAENDFTPKIYYEDELSLDEITYNFAQSLNILEPFGKANKEPVFITKNVYAEDVTIIGADKNTLKMSFRASSNRKISGVCFKSVDKFVEMLRTSFSDSVCEKFKSGRIKTVNCNLDIAYTIGINEYNGNSSLQLQIVDFEMNKI